MNFDPYGVANLGLDGVFRTYAYNGTVLDYRKLSPAQISAYIMSGCATNSTAQVEMAMFQGVDGNKVNNETQLWHPAQEYRPINVPKPESKAGTALKADLTIHEESFAHPVPHVHPKHPHAVLPAAPTPTACTYSPCGKVKGFPFDRNYYCRERGCDYCAESAGTGMLRCRNYQEIGS